MKLSAFLQEAVSVYEAQQAGFKVTVAGHEPQVATSGADAGDDDLNEWLIELARQGYSDASLIAEEAGKSYQKIIFSGEFNETLLANIDNDPEMSDAEATKKLISSYVGAILVFDATNGLEAKKDPSKYVYYKTQTELDAEWSALENGEQTHDFEDIDGDQDIDDIVWAIIEDTVEHDDDEDADIKNPPEPVDAAGDMENHKEDGYYALYEINENFLKRVRQFDVSAKDETDDEDAVDGISYSDGIKDFVGFIAFFGIEPDESDATLDYYDTKADLREAWSEVIGEQQ